MAGHARGRAGGRPTPTAGVAQRRAGGNAALDNLSRGRYKCATILPLREGVRLYRPGSRASDPIPHCPEGGPG